MGTGNDNNSWGSNANTLVFQILEDAIANALTSSVAGGTLDLSGTPPPAAASQVRYAALIFTGTLLSNQIVQVPNLTKFWWVQNQTSGAFTLKFKTSSGSASTAIPQNSGWQLVYCDGANGIVVFPFNTKQMQMPDGSASAPAFSNINETNSGWYRNGTQDWRLSINGSDVLQVTGTGAGSPSIVNVLSPNLLEVAGAKVPSVSGTPTTNNIAKFSAATVLADGGIAAAAVASLTAADQTLSGGANVTVYDNGSKSGAATFTVDCGACPLQKVTNAGAFTLAAPASDGSCLLQITNGGTAGTITFSGWTSTSTNTGDAYATTNGNIYVLSIWRIGGNSGYFIKAMQ